MPWGPEDWNECQGQETTPPVGGLAHLIALNRILVRLPDRKSKALAFLGSTPLQAIVAEGFAKVVNAGLDEGGLSVLQRRFDVVTAVDSSISPSRLAPVALFERVRQSLVEGGVVVGAFTARAPGRAPFPMETGPADLEFHEIELQYCLRRCGFQGLRIRRFPPEAGRGATLLCMAVRRALN